MVIVQNEASRLLTVLQSLVASTPDGTYEVIIVALGSDAETEGILNSLEGDVSVIRGDSGTSFDDALKVAARSARFDQIAIATGATVFQAGWSQQATTTPNVVSKSVLLASNAATPEHALGYRLGNALDDVNAAARTGAPVGQLPPSSAEAIRERLDAEEEYRLLQLARAGRDVCWTDEHEVEPLVTVRIATQNRAEELMELALPAILAQSYERLDVLVIGDNADDSTIKAMQSITDERVRFINLPGPFPYPDDPWKRWLVAGAPAVNAAIDLATGSWITSTDDDDEMTPDHVEVLLKHARDNRLEFVWSKTLMETPEGWQVRGGPVMVPGATTSASVIWSMGLRFMKESTTCWKLNEPQDGNLWRRMSQIGVKMGFLDHITYRYYMGGNMRQQLLEGAIQ